MINQVLMDHPRSAKAHFVAAELASRAGKLNVARGQLQQAEQLDPGLHFASPQALKAELGVSPASGYEVELGPLRHSYPWFPGILLAALGFLIWAIVRRRRATLVPYSGTPMGGGPYPGSYPGPMGGSVGGGMGSGIAGGLVSGLALGAGVSRAKSSRIIFSTAIITPKASGRWTRMRRRRMTTWGQRLRHRQQRKLG